MDRGRAMRDNRSDAKTFAYGCKRCAQEIEIKSTKLKEMPVLQRFLKFTMSMITARSKSLTSQVEAQTVVARTLSRAFWQQKNFCAQRLRVSAPLAKDGFLLESTTADSGLHAPRTLRIVHHRKRLMTNACCRNAASSGCARQRCR